MNGTAGTALPAVSSNAATAASVVVVGGGDTTTSAITPTGSGPPVQNWRRVGSFRTHSGVNQIIGGATVGEPPSRRREEAAALLNLHKRVGTQGMTRTPVQTPSGYQQFPNHIVNRAANSNRPHLLLKILSNRPGIVTEEEEVNTDWLDSDFIAECLCWHNVYRQRHGVPVLTLCPQLCERAQSWANHLAHTNSFFYKNDKDVGQNLFCRLTNTLQTDVTGQEVASYWYGAVRQYNYFKEPDVLHANVNAGHFTQMVWASTRKFGVGKACSRAGKILVAAYYWPAGNISGQFQENVLPPLPETETDSVSGSDSSTSRSTVELGT